MKGRHQNRRKHVLRRQQILKEQVRRSVNVSGLVVADNRESKAGAVILQQHHVLRKRVCRWKNGQVADASPELRSTTTTF
jgi:hypothetical protein